MKQMTGYFGGYISKKQKVGQYELKRSIDALPLLQEKLQKRPLKASAQLAHVCNRFFSVLESKGILRMATEEFLLASRYRPDDELNAEFIRSFRHRIFRGTYYLQRYDTLKHETKDKVLKTVIPKTSAVNSEFDEVALYGLRPQDPRVSLLSPWFFVQWWWPHRLQRPSSRYHLTKWTAEWDAKSGRLPIAGRDFVLNEVHVSANAHWLMSGCSQSIGQGKGVVEVKRSDSRKVYVYNDKPAPGLDQIFEFATQVPNPYMDRSYLQLACTRQS